MCRLITYCTHHTGNSSSITTTTRSIRNWGSRCKRVGKSQRTQHWRRRWCTRNGITFLLLFERVQTRYENLKVLTDTCNQQRKTGQIRTVIHGYCPHSAFPPSCPNTKKGTPLLFVSAPILFPPPILYAFPPTFPHPNVRYYYIHFTRPTYPLCLAFQPRHTNHSSDTKSI